MNANRYSFDSQFNFDSDGLVQTISKTSDQRRHSLNHLPLNHSSGTSSISNCKRTSRNELLRNLTQTNSFRFRRKLRRNEDSDHSSINSLFINRVKSFTGKMRRHMIQTSMDSDSIPLDVLYPTKYKTCADMLPLLPVSQTNSSDNSSLILTKRSSDSFKMMGTNKAYTNRDFKSTLRHSINGRSTSSTCKKDVICFQHDFKSIVGSSKSSRCCSSTSASLDQHRRQRLKCDLRYSGSLSCSSNRESSSNETSCISNLSDPLNKFTTCKACYVSKAPRRSLSDGSLNQIKNRTLKFNIEISPILSDRRSSVEGSSKLEEIEEIDHEDSWGRYPAASEAIDEYSI